MNEGESLRETAKIYDIGYGKKQWTFKLNKNDSTAKDSRASLYTAN